MDAVLYNKIQTEADRIIAACSGGGIDFSTIRSYVADYTNDPVTLTKGSLDKYYRRIYGT